MGDVIVVFRVMPRDMKYFDDIKKELEALKPKRLEEEPIAFGLKALRFTTLVPDAEGKLAEVEKKLKSIKDIESAEIVEMSRSL